MNDAKFPDEVLKKLSSKHGGIDFMFKSHSSAQAYPQVKVVMLTGHGSEKDEEEARKLGAFDYLQKPSGLERIIDSIKKAYRSAIDTAVATTFAEAGEYETARKVMEDTEKKEKPDD